MTGPGDLGFFVPQQQVGADHSFATQDPVQCGLAGCEASARFGWPVHTALGRTRVEVSMCGRHHLRGMLPGEGAHDDPRFEAEAWTQRCADFEAMSGMDGTPVYIDDLLTGSDGSDPNQQHCGSDWLGVDFGAGGGDEHHDVHDAAKAALRASLQRWADGVMALAECTVDTVETAHAIGRQKIKIK